MVVTILTFHIIFLFFRKNLSLKKKNLCGFLLVEKKDFLLGEKYNKVVSLVFFFNFIFVWESFIY